MQTTGGFLDALANHLSTVSTLSLTKGTNLFAENYIDDPSIITDQVVLYEDSVEQLLDFRHMHFNWNVKFVTTRTKRIESINALIPLHDYLLDKKRFLIVSDSSQSFTILTTRSIMAPDLIERTDSGRFASAFTLQFQLIPD